MLVQEETRFKNQGSHLVHYVSHRGNQGARKRFMKKHDKGKRPLKINGGPVQIQKKHQRAIIVNFVGNQDISRRIA